MRRFIIIVLLMAIISGCSDQSTVHTPSIELTSSTVRIVSDIPEQQPIVDDQLIEHIGLVSLQYDFEIINTGDKNFMVTQNAHISESDSKTIAFTIEPNPELKAFANEVKGINLYSERNHGGGFLASPTVLEPNEEGTYSIEYILGSIEEIPEMTSAPNKEQLDELREKAVNANLVIYYENEKIKSFALDK